MKDVFVVGISFKSADVVVRSSFSLNEHQQQEFLLWAKEYGFNNFLILSTCNRIEIYGTGTQNDINALSIKLSEICNQSLERFNEYKFIKKEADAILHIFQVSAGLDSLILGDYEILGQFKVACRLSKLYGLLTPVFDRMTQMCMQASKDIKSQTDFSKGTVSASYAVIEVIKDYFGESQAKALLVGVGKLGKNIAKNIKIYLPNVSLTLTNRTISTAEELSMQEGFDLIPIDEIRQHVKDFDIAIFCTEGGQFLLGKEDVENSSIRLLLDLSVPQSVNPACESLPDVTLMDIDSISKILDRTFENRKQYLPIANEIIDKQIKVFHDWEFFYENKRQSIVKLKERLVAMGNQHPIVAKLDESQKEFIINKTLKMIVANHHENDEILTNEVLLMFETYCHQNEGNN